MLTLILLSLVTTAAAILLLGLACCTRTLRTAASHAQSEHARLYAEARRQAEELATLRQASLAVASTLDIQEAIGRILEQLALVVPHDSASVQLRRGGDSEVFGCRGFPQPEQIIGLRFPISDNPLCQEVYTLAAPKILAETIGAAGFLQGPGRQIRSWLALPLVVGEHVIGMLALDSATPGHFTEAHTRLGMAFAAQVAVALKHAQSYRREVRARERLFALQQAAREIAAHRSTPTELYGAFHHATAQLMPADAFVIILFDLTTEVAHDVYLAYNGAIYPGDYYPYEGSFAQFVIDRGKPLLIDDFASFTACALDQFGEDDHTRSGLAVPLYGRTRTLGLIFTQSDQAAAYSEEDVVLLELLAAHAATAIENGALFAEVERLASTDALTGLANRRHFFLQARLLASRAQRSGQPLAMALLDLDHFKTVNDTFGHQAGDQVLKVVAQTCRDSLRAGDLVGRYGGEEFVFLMPGTDLASALKVAERICKAIAELRISFGATSIHLTASLGVAVEPGCADIQAVLAQADAALYTAKGAGRNRVMAFEG